MDELGGCKSGRVCTNQNFVARQAIEKMIEKDTMLFMLFTDLEKAYDNVHREKLWRVLGEFREYGVQRRLL